MEEEVALRLLEPGDAPYLLKWLTDPVVLEWYEGRDNPFTPEMVREHFYGEDEVSRCIILYRGEPVGYVQVYPFRDGWAMDQFIGEPGCWGKHIGRRFIRQVLDYLAEKKNARAVYVDPHTDNERAIRCYEACGFQKAELLPQSELHEGTYRDCWLMRYTP